MSKQLLTIPYSRYGNVSSANLLRLVIRIPKNHKLGDLIQQGKIQGVHQVTIRTPLKNWGLYPITQHSEVEIKNFPATEYIIMTFASVQKIIPIHKEFRIECFFTVSECDIILKSIQDFHQIMKNL